MRPAGGSVGQARRFHLTPAWRLVALGAAFAALLVFVAVFERHPLADPARSQLWALSTLHFSEFERKLPARASSDWYAVTGPGAVQRQLEVPTLQPDGGHFAGPVAISVSSEPHDHVRCTTDGSIPTRQDSVYSRPIQLEVSSVVRCRTFHSGFPASATSTATFVINAPGRLPVLAMTMDPTSLTNPYTGIYFQFNERGSEWERDAHVEYLPRSGHSLALSGRVRIHGSASRSRQKKSFRFYFVPPEATDSEPNILEWPGAEPERVVVINGREAVVSRDELFQILYASHGGVSPKLTPVFLYINGRPWGLYYVKERVDEEYLRRRFGPGEYDLLDTRGARRPEVLAGDLRHWNRTTEFFSSNDLSDPLAFSAAGDLIDIDNFTIYWLLNIYAANFDWPNNNMRMFRNRTSGDGRWRWITWDADAAFDLAGWGLQHDTLSWSTRDRLRQDLRYNYDHGLRDTEDMMAYTLIARKLLENDAYRQRFKATMHQLLDTSLHPVRVMALLDSLHAEIEADQSADWDRWDAGGADAGRESYRADMQRVKHFIQARPAIVTAHFDRFFQETD